jgi:4-hydroxybenzoate polyprenyltransferase
MTQPASPFKANALWLINVSRLHISFLAAMGVLTFGWIFTGRYLWNLTWICALDWYIVNLLNKTVDLPEDRVNRIAGTDWISRHRHRLMYALFGVLVASLILVHLFNPAITPLRVACHLLGIFYNWPLLPGSKRLKDIYFWKNATSAIGFLITLMGYPLATAFRWGQNPIFPMGISWATVVTTALFLFVFVLSYEIIYDLRDIDGDRMMGYRTYPVVHGRQGAVYLIDGLMAISFMILLIGYVSQVVPWRIMIMAAAPALQFIIYKKMLKNSGITARYCTVITWLAAGLFVIYHLWVLADLPGAG